MHGGSRRGATHAPAVLALIAAGLMMGACSRGEPQSKQAIPNAPIETRAREAAPAASEAPVDEALKARLARQEAAARMFERNVLQPPPPKAAEPKAPAAPTAAASPSAIGSTPAPVSNTPPPLSSTPPSPQRTVDVAKAPDAPRFEAPKPAAPKAAPARTDLAAARPSAAPEAIARLVSRVEPDFPAEAVRGGIDRGTVRARMTIDAAGAVTDVEILEATPRRVFDRAVTRALSQWRFNEGAPSRTAESEIDFRR